jgi:hypothetical protein
VVQSHTGPKKKKKKWDPFSKIPSMKRAGRETQVVGHLPNKCEYHQERKKKKKRTKLIKGAVDMRI